MESILTLDISRNRARALVLEVGDTDLKLIEEHESSSEISEIIEQIYTELESSQEQLTDNLDDENDDFEDEQELLEKEASSAALGEIIQELIAQVQTPWVSSVLVVPSLDYLSLNIQLPFGDERSINRVIDLEVQDLIPFSVDEFHVQHCVVSEELNGEHDVHVGMMPRNYIRSILTGCKVANYEPNILSTQTSALSALYYLAPDYMEKNSAVIYLDQQRCYICVAIDGRVKTDRIIINNSQDATHTDIQDNPEILRDLKLSISAVEKRYGVTIAKVYVIGSAVPANKLQQSLGRSVEEISTDEFIKSERESTQTKHLVGLSAIFARDIEPPSILTNFRSREFSYNPQIKQLLTFGKKISPFLVILLLLILAYFTSVYTMRAYQISSLRSAIGTEILQIAPNLAFNPGEELGALSAENLKIDQELQALGSRGKYSPLDSLLELSKDLARIQKRSPDINMKRIKVTGKAVTLEGNAPNYAAVSRLERILRQNNKYYCGFRFNTSGSSEKPKFDVELTLCEL